MSGWSNLTTALPSDNTAASFIPFATDSMLLSGLQLGALAGAVYYLASKAVGNGKKKSGYPYPPGPKPSAIPFLGNIPDMPSEQGAFPYSLSRHIARCVFPPLSFSSSFIFCGVSRLLINQ
jgi:hypothetical protein